MRTKLFFVIAVSSMFLGYGCGNTEKAVVTKQDEKVLNVAYQYGIAYAPVILANQKEMIENSYKEKTGKELNINWIQMNSGADINTAFASGELDVGFMGIAPAISGVSKEVGYKIFTNLSGQEHGLMTNQKEILRLGDFIGTKNQIALVNMGSIQHIILAKALVSVGEDAHALDANIVAMKHPDGMAALENKSVSGHLTSSPYIYKERENTDLTEIKEIAEVWSKEDSFIVGVASEELKEKDEQLYEALREGIAESIEMVNENPGEAAKITCEFDGNTSTEEEVYLKSSNYSTETKGIFELAVFMAKHDFIETAPEDFYELAFENVKGD